MKTNTRNWKKTAGILVIVAALTFGTGALIATAQPGMGRGPGAGGPGAAMGPGMGQGFGSGGPMGPGRGLAVGRRGAGMGQGAWWDNPKVVEKLELSEEQQEQLGDLATEHQKEQIENRAVIESLRVDLQQLWRADELDDDEILETTSKIADLQAAAQVARTKHRLDVAGVLTDEQQDQIREFIQQARDKVRQGIRQRMQKRFRDPDTHRDRGFGWRQDQPPAPPTDE